MREIIDTHLHLWDLSRFSLPWLSQVQALDRDYTEQDYLEAMGHSDCRVDKAVYVEVDVAPDQKLAEADYIAGVCADPDSVVGAAIVSVDMGSSGAGDILRRHAKSRYIRGVRHVLHVDSSPRGACLKSWFIENVQLMGNLGMLFEGCLRCPELSDFVELVSRCPETSFVLDHMGNVNPRAIAEKDPDRETAEYADTWRRDMADLAAFPNVSVKVSGLDIFGPWTPEDLAPSLNHCFEVFGEDRVMFASNFPVVQLSLGASPWLESLLAITADQSETFQDKLFNLNAKRIYQL